MDSCVRFIGLWLVQFALFGTPTVTSFVPLTPLEYAVFKSASILSVLFGGSIIYFPAKLPPTLAYGIIVMAFGCLQYFIFAGEASFLSVLFLDAVISSVFTGIALFTVFELCDEFSSVQHNKKLLVLSTCGASMGVAVRDYVFANNTKTPAFQVLLVAFDIVLVTGILFLMRVPVFDTTETPLSQKAYAERKRTLYLSCLISFLSAAVHSDSFAFGVSCLAGTLFGYFTRGMYKPEIVIIFSVFVVFVFNSLACFKAINEPVADAVIGSFIGTLNMILLLWILAPTKDYTQSVQGIWLMMASAIPGWLVFLWLSLIPNFNQFAYMCFFCMGVLVFMAHSEAQNTIPKKTQSNGTVVPTTGVPRTHETHL